MDKSIKNPATSGQTTPAVHLRHLRELINKAENSVQSCEVEFVESHVRELLSDAVILAEAARDILVGIEADDGKEIDPPQVKIESNLELDHFNPVELINLETSKIAAFADALIVLNSYDLNLFSDTTETLLCNIIDCAEAADAAAGKIQLKVGVEK